MHLPACWTYASPSFPPTKEQAMQGRVLLLLDLLAVILQISAL